MSSYTSEAAMKKRFGTATVVAWANLEDATGASARYTQAIAIASEHIDDVLRKSKYRIPLVKPSGSGTPVIIGEIADILGGMWLFDAKNAASKTPGQERYQREREWAEQTLLAIQTGAIEIDALW
jgi:phage gp36-like protein